jgi:hypothetical protein
MNGILAVGSSAVLGHESQQSDILYRMCRMSGIICQPGQSPQTYLAKLALLKSQKRIREECEQSHRRRLASRKREDNKALKMKPADTSEHGSSSEKPSSKSEAHRLEAETQHLPKNTLSWPNDPKLSHADGRAAPQTR